MAPRGSSSCRSCSWGRNVPTLAVPSSRAGPPRAAARSCMGAWRGLLWILGERAARVQFLQALTRDQGHERAEVRTQNRSLVRMWHLRSARHAPPFRALLGEPIEPLEVGVDLRLVMAMARAFMEAHGC